MNCNGTAEVRVKRKSYRKHWQIAGKVQFKTWTDCGAEAFVYISVLLKGPPEIGTWKSFISSIALLVAGM